MSRLRLLFSSNTFVCKSQPVTASSSKVGIFVFIENTINTLNRQYIKAKTITHFCHCLEETKLSLICMKLSLIDNQISLNSVLFLEFL